MLHSAPHGPPDPVTIHYVGGLFDGATEHIAGNGAYIVGEACGRLLRDERNAPWCYESCGAWDGSPLVTLYSVTLPCWFVWRAAGYEPVDDSYDGFLPPSEQYREGAQ